MTPLKINETLYQVAIDSVLDEIVVIDRDGKIMMVNEAWRKFSRESGLEPGKPPPGMEVGDNYLKACQPNTGIAADHNIKARNGIEAVLVGRLPSFSMEYPCHSPDQRRWFKMLVLPLGSDGQGVVIAHTNITEFKLIEEALRLSEERWKFALEGSGDGVWDWNIQTSEALYSKRWKEMLGFTESEIGNQSQEWSNRLHPDDIANIMAAIQAHIDGKTPSVTHEFRMLCKDQSYKWILGRGMIVSRDDNNQPLRLVGTNTDITEQRRVIAAMRESEERFRGLANAAPTLIWTAGKDKLCNWFNDTWLAYTGRSMEQELGNGWTEGVHHDDVDHCLETYVSHFDECQPFTMEYRLRNHQGEYQWFIDVGRPRVDELGQFVGYIGMLTNINDRNLMEKSLRLAQYSLDHVEEEIFWITREARIIDANALACKALGYSREELINLSVADVDPVFQAKNWPEHWQELKEKGSLRFESVHRTREGKIYHVEVLANYFEYEGKEYNCAFARDITERKNTETALIEKEERLALATLHNGVGIWDWNLETLEMVWDDSMFALYNISRDDFSGAVDAWEKSLHPDDRERSDREVQDALSGGKPFDTEFRVVWPNGEVRHIKAVAKVFWDENGKPLRMLGTNLDITERKLLEDELKRQVKTDFLTGLNSRSHFIEQGELELSRSIRYENPLSIFMLDIDFFKQVNDSHGHKMGDTVLKKLAEVCGNTLRDVDIVGRLGGEEFAILLPETEMNDAKDVAERLRNAIASAKVPLSTGDQPLQFTVSIGLASLASKDDNLDVLLNLADKALYEAKNSGRNRVCIAQ
jgi:diguanylate cyclase (GGDEF)-like protein/PAS domain S-box-containing protein